MSPQLEALAMLNKLFESRDGRPVDSVTLTRHDYGQLFLALAVPEVDALQLLRQCDALFKEWDDGMDEQDGEDYERGIANFEAARDAVKAFLERHKLFGRSTGTLGR